MLKKTVKYLTDLIFPEECIFCASPKNLLCSDCRSLLDIFSTHKPYRGRSLRDLYAATSYQNRFVKGSIAQFKYEPFLKCLKTPLAGVIRDHLDLIEKKPDFSDYTLVAVPLARNRMRWRGFNQAEELAKEISASLGIPVLLGLLEKTGNSAPQATLSAQERKENIKNTIRCKKSGQIMGKKILLIDDIFTTGATMEECARILLKNGARTITGLVVARSEPADHNS